MEVVERDPKVVARIVDIGPESFGDGLAPRPAMDDKVGQQVANALTAEVGMIDRGTVATNLQRAENADA